MSTNWSNSIANLGRTQGLNVGNPTQLIAKQIKFLCSKHVWDLKYEYDVRLNLNFPMPVNTTLSGAPK